jgi:colicin import membrane protein
MDAVMRPQSQEDWRPGMAMAFVAHGLLLLALTLGVQWQTQTPPVVEAEMWAEVPRVVQLSAEPATAPPAAKEIPAEPVPTPVPKPAPLPVLKPVPAKVSTKAPVKEQFVPDSLQVRERLSKAREALLQASSPAAVPGASQPAPSVLKLPVVIPPAPAKLPEPPPKIEPPPQPVKPMPPAPATPSAATSAKPTVNAGPAPAGPKLNEVLTRQEVERARQDNLKRMMAKLSEDALHSAGLTPEYAGRINARIKPNIVFTGTPTGNWVATVEVRCAPDGKILSRKVLMPSGSAAWNEAVLRAIDRTAVLPRNEQGKVPAVIQLVFNPLDFKLTGATPSPP